MLNNHLQKRTTTREPTDADVPAFIKSMSVKGKRGWVPPEYREELAKSLGSLVSDIGSGDPATGLKRIKATLAEGEMPGLQEHRQRIILFPEEQPADRHTWVAGWGEYLRFAEKALELLADGRTGGALARWKLTELKRLVSIGQGIEPEADKGGKIATALLRSWGQKVVQIATNGTRIEELWEALDETPVAVQELDDKQVPTTLKLGDLAFSAEELPRERDVLASRVFVTSASCNVMDKFGDRADISWSRPVIFLGCLSYEDYADVFILPPELRGMEDQIQNWTGHLHHELPPEFDAWFSGNHEGLSDLPNINYEEGLGFGWSKSKFFALCGIYLRIIPGIDGKPEAVISHIESESCIPKWHINIFDNDISDINMDVVGYLLKLTGFSPDQIVEDFPHRARLVATRDDMKNLGLPSGSFEYQNGLQQIVIDPEEFGLEWEDIYGTNENSDGENENDIPAWAENFSSPFSGVLDSRRDRVLFNRDSCYKFYPAFKYDESLPSAAPAGSVAAALIANAHAAPDQRIATLLRIQAEKIAKAGLTFVDGLKTFHQSAIDNM